MAEDTVLLDTGSASVSYRVRTISLEDLRQSVIKGLEDFNARPTHAIFIIFLIPLIMLIAFWVGTDQRLVPLVFPILTGFALLGPFLALGLYELSRQREMGQNITFRQAFNIFRHKAVSSLVSLGVILTILFGFWLSVAMTIYQATLGFPAPPTFGEFAAEILTTGPGWVLIVFGNGIGLLFAMIALAISVVSFPLIIDRHVTAGTAIMVSVDVVVHNPVVMAVWGFVVAMALLLGTLPALAGLVIVFPVLGHATWHLYRRVVE